MAYCAQADIEKRISQRIVIQLCDDEKLATSSTTITAAVALNSSITGRIDEAIVDADAMIDSYIRKQYDVPLETPPSQITRISVDLVVYFLHCRRRSEMGIPEDIEALYNKAVRYLEGVNKGNLDLGIDPVPAASSIVVSDTDGEDRAFTADTLKDF